MNADRMLSLGQTQLIQMSIVIAVVGLATMLSFRRRPHLAYALWLLALIKCLTPPLWSSSLGVFSWAGAARDAAPSSIVANHDLVPPRVDRAPQTARFVSEVESAVAPARPQLHISRAAVVAIIWSCGAIVMLIVPLVRSIRLRRTVERDSVSPPQALRQTLPSNVRLIVARDNIGPALLGIVRPAIVIPEAMLDGPDERLRLALAHELAHVRRGDHLVAMLQWIAQAIWWFHPLVWWMNRRLNATREASCDEQVIARSHCEPEEYAQMLLDVLKLRRTRRPAPMPALGVSAMGITTRRLDHIMNPKARFHGRAPVAAWLLTLICGLLLLPGAGLTLHARQTTAPATTRPAEATTFHGVVVDHTTGQPIAGATVTMHRMTSINGELAPFTTPEDVTTDEQGRYSFVVTAEQTAMPWILIKAQPRHPQYATCGPIAGLDIAGHLREKKSGEEPTVKKLEMMPGEEVAGVIVDNRGDPLADVPIEFTTIAGDFDKRFLALQPTRIDATTKTDANGRFRFNAIKGAKITDFWAKSDKFAILYHSVRDQRGDLGTFRLRNGIKVSGSIFDENGTPLKGVTAWLQSEETNEVMNAVTYRSAKSDDHGHFTFAPVKPGSYRLSVGKPMVLSETGRISYPSLGAVFANQFLNVRYAPDKPEMNVEVRPVPSVSMTVQSLDSSGRPNIGQPPDIFGRFNGEEFHAGTGGVREDGKYVARVPKGLERAKLLVHGGEGMAIRTRRGADGALRAGHSLDLGTIDGDVNDIQVINYRQPVLIVRAVGNDGRLLEDYKPRIDYPRDQVPEEKVIRPNGIKGDVSFFKQKDGKWNSRNELLPDQEFTLTVEAPGFQSSSQTLTLSEGEKREIEVQLAKQ